MVETLAGGPIEAQLGPGQVAAAGSLEGLAQGIAVAELAQ